MHQYVVSLPIDPIFMYDELKAIVFVQEGFRGLVLNSATAFLHTNPVAMYLNDFAVVPTANMVNISWSVRGEPGVFELEASSGHVDWSVPYTWEGTNFTASDNSPNLASGGTVTYSLYHRTGSNSRELLRSETVELPNTPAVTRFMGANPNPFNPQTNVKFSVGSSQRVLVAVYDMSGRRVAVLADEVFGQGIHTLLWDGRDAFGHAVSSGTYFARMEADNFLSTMKLMLVR